MVVFLLVVSFCGGCPIYTREKRACRGAELNHSRCEKCKNISFMLFWEKDNTLFPMQQLPMYQI